MQIQSNRYFIWQLIPALATFGLGIYIKIRPRKKPESNSLALMLYTEAAWSLFSAIQLFNSDPAWQTFWHTISFLAIVIIPIAWFMLAVNLAEGYFNSPITAFKSRSRRVW